MPPRKKKVLKECNRREMITMEVKKEIIEKHERGMRVSEIARLYNKPSSTICTILKRKEEIRGLDAAKGVTKVTKQRPRVLEDVEKLLLVWINEMQIAGDAVTENSICEKAKELYTDLVSRGPHRSTESREGFKASRGWFDNFRRRSGIHSVATHGEMNFSDVKTTEYQNIPICAPPLLNPNGTKNNLRKLPKRTYIITEENPVDCHETAYDIQNIKEEKLSNDELIDLHNQLQQVIVEISSDDEEARPTGITTNETKEICKMWEIVRNFVEKHHPNNIVAMRATRSFNKRAMTYFHKFLKNRSKRDSLCRIHVKSEPISPTDII